MRILLFGALTSTHSAKWANSLVARGHQVMLACYPVNLKPNITFDKRIVIHKLRFGGVWGYYLNVPEVKKIIKEFKPDVINAHYASGFGTMCRWANARPFVLSCYGSDIFTYPFLNKFNMYNICKNLRYADAVGCTGFAMADQVRFLLKEPGKEITVTPFGVNLDYFYPNKENVKKERPVIGIVKYLEPIYDIPLLIRAFEILYNNSEEKPILRIYGDGELKQELEVMAKELGVGDSVFFMGPIPNTEVGEAIRSMDVFVNCSHKESFGVNMVEAMACGIPVVATATEGAKEVIDNNVTGIVLNDRNPETMANALKELLADGQLREKMGKAGRERALDLYDWGKNVEIMENLYKKLANM